MSPTRNRSMAAARTAYIAVLVLVAITVGVATLWVRNLREREEAALAWNEESSDVRDALSDLQDRVAEVDAPANDVFETRAFAAESARLKAAIAAFQRDLQRCNGIIARSHNERRFQPRLLRVAATVQEIGRDGDQIIATLAAGDERAAASRMAKMDRRYAIARNDVDTISDEIRRIQREDLRRQHLRFVADKRHEILLLALVSVLVFGLLLYGHRVSRDAARAREREQHFDVLERAHAEREDALRSAEEQRDLLAQAEQMAEIGSWQWNTTTNDVRWSDELFRIFGLDRSNTPSYRLGLDLVHPDDRARVEQTIRAGFGEQEPFAFEHRIVRHDGSTRVLHAQVMFSGTAGHRQIFGIIQDITARREAEEATRLSEERFQIAARATNDVIRDWNIVTGSCWVNEAMHTVFGREHAGDIGIDRWYAAIHPADVVRVRRSIDEAVHGTASYWSNDYQIATASGEWRDVLDRGYIIRGDNGTAIRMIAAAIDITERRTVERMKDEFVSTVSHELRTPLTSIKGALGLLASGRLGTLPEKAQRLLEIASGNTDRLVRLINDILDIERMESGSVTLSKSRVATTDLVNLAVDGIRPLADRQNIAIATHVEPVFLVGDADRLVQTLTNLIGNAIKFSPPRSTVTIAAARDRDDVVFSVADQGRGIPADRLDSIFERFQQVDASDARDKGGSGLGLAICRSIVRQHGGDINATSEVGKGSTFTFTIPLGPTSEKPETRPESDKRLVYVCDDDEEVRDMIDFHLSSRGYRVRQMPTGVDLLAAVASEKPDAILLDLFMPEINGWEIVARLKSNAETSDIPVVIVSVLSSDETGVAGTELSGWVQKPFDENAVASAIERALGPPLDRKPRVMLIEDDADLARVICASFERYGIDILHAKDGEEAIELAARTDPDLVVLDLVLPGIDGFAVVDWLKDHDRWRGVPMVVYSAVDTTPSQRERLRLGPTEFLTKSRVTPEAFERRVISLLDALTRKSEGSAIDVT